jgi:hypothetical protein
MTKEHSENLLFVAVLLSLAIHAALMFFARERVMARIAHDEYKSVKRVSLVVDRVSASEMQLISDADIQDEPPQKDSPAVELLGSPPIAELDNDVAKEIVKPQITSVDVPKAEIDIADIQTFSIEPVSVKTERDMKQEPSFEFSVPNLESGKIMMVSPNAKIPLANNKPSFSIKVPPVLSEENVAAKIGGDKIGLRNELFTPVDTVYKEIDRKFVEAEKEAVKRLLLSDSAEDLTSRIKIDVKSYVQGQWIYFKLLLSDIGELSVVPKDFVLLIDASRSIGSERMRSLRKSAKELLRSAINSYDRFNIVAFRDKYSYAFKSWQHLDIKSLNAADSFIESLASFGRTDVFSTIESVLTLPRNPARPLVALVVTDAEPNVGVRQTAKIISKFSALNDGLISIYMYGVKNEANRELINVLTRANRGESLVYVGSRKTAGKGIAKLSERFRDPVLSDITHKFSAGTLVEYYPKRLKNLYKDSPVELYARTPIGTKEVYFQLKALNGEKPYESLFKLTFPQNASADIAVKASFEAERDIYMKTLE